VSVGPLIIAVSGGVVSGAGGSGAGGGAGGGGAERQAVQPAPAVTSIIRHRTDSAVSLFLISTSQP